MLGFISAFLAALLQASSSTLDKFILLIRGFSFRHYIGSSFPLLFITSFAIFFISGVGLPVEGFRGDFLILLLAASALLIILNTVYYRALDHDNLSVLEPIALLSQIPTILLAAFVFQSERQPILVLLGIVASLAVIWAHVEKHHIRFVKESKSFMVIALTVMPLMAVLTLKLLEVWHPISLEMIRHGIITIVMVPIFWRSIQTMPRQALWPMFLTSFVTAIGWIFYNYAFQAIGIVHTVLIFSLEPALVYLFALVFLKEKFKPKNLVSFAIVLGAVVVAQLVST